MTNSEKIVLPLDKAGVSKDAKVHDLWLKSDVAKVAGVYEVELSPHGAMLFALE